ncbi:MULTISPECIES: DUF4160 domain-containing protein [unclassified Imperialibacter]|uniref:DUF4160 domain-containing protein n=1 Tax=unclassified Imperialibacter TaxID=2629706 RepID=UPI00125AE944|nr:MULTISPECIES: DUF4160 domain-containing protein [unclassified Imperialibacter]CAD5254261.1 conserved hypothetical protein [Imperialibacter sp. 89]CAD5267197.1 conserved hypothetical protein [Imperialibacter sp. 75]VVT00746.1 conserved hypothetical protein [Imperialibacter sp. EC-SDR9]
MPRVLTIQGYIFYFFAADCAERAHMHVKKGDASGKLWIKPDIAVFYLKGFKQKEKRQLLKLAEENIAQLTEYWDAYCNN